jgi:hypothetical protein
LVTYPLEHEVEHDHVGTGLARGAHDLLGGGHAGDAAHVRLRVDLVRHPAAQLVVILGHDDPERRSAPRYAGHCG